MGYKKFYYLALIFLIGFLGFSSVYAAELDPSDVLGEIPGHFEKVIADDGEPVYYVTRYFPKNYTLSNYKRDVDNETFSNLMYRIPLLDEYSRSSVLLCRSGRYDSCKVGDWFYSVSGVTNIGRSDGLNDIPGQKPFGLPVSAFYGSNFSINNFITGKYGSYVKINLSNGDSVRFRLKIKQSETMFEEYILNDNISENYDASYDINTRGKIYQLGNDMKVKYKFPKEIKLIDDDFNLFELNDIYTNPDSSDYFYLYVGGSGKYGQLSESDYEIDGDELHITLPIGGVSQGNSMYINNYGDSFYPKFAAMPYDFNLDNLNPSRSIYLAFNPTEMCETLEGENNFKYELNYGGGFDILGDIDFSGLDDYYLSYTGYVFNLPEFGIDLYKIDLDGVVSDTPIDNSIYSVKYYRGFDFNFDSDVDDGGYKVVFSDLQNGDTRLCNSLGYNISLSLTSADNDNGVYTLATDEYNNKFLTPFSGRYIPMPYEGFEFINHADVLFDFSDDGYELRLTSIWNIGPDRLEEFSLKFTSVRDGSSISFDESDLDEYGDLDPDIVLDRVSGDGINWNIGGYWNDEQHSDDIYILDYEAKDIYGNTDKYTSLGYLREAYSGVRFYRLEIDDILRLDYSDTNSDYDINPNIIDDLTYEILGKDSPDAVCRPGDDCVLDNFLMDNLDIPMVARVRFVGGLEHNFYFSVYSWGSYTYLDDFSSYITPRNYMEPPIDFYDDDILTYAFYDQDGDEIITLDESSTYESFLELVSQLKNYTDQYINYTINLKDAHGDIVYHDEGGFYNSAGYYKNRDKNYIMKCRKDYEIYFDCPSGLDGGADDRFIGGQRLDVTGNEFQVKAQELLDGVLFYKTYFFAPKLERSGEYSLFVLDGLSPYINIIETDKGTGDILENTGNTINMSKIYICQFAIETLDELDGVGCMNYRDIVDQNIMIPSYDLYMYGLDDFYINDIVTNIDLKIDMYIDIYGYKEEEPR